MANQRLYLNDDQIKLINGTSRFCWICGMFQSNIRALKDGRKYLRESVFSDDGIVEHLEQIVGKIKFE